jgi:peroxiredoxin
MKKLLLLLTATFIVVSCNKAGKNEYIITGTIKGIADGKTVVLEKQDETGQLKPIDTVKITDGEFTFTGTSKEPELHLIQVEAIQGKVPFILENGDIELTLVKDSINNSSVGGTYNNEELNSYRENGMKIQKKMLKFQKDNMQKITTAQQKQDTAVVNSIRKEYSKFQDEFVNQSNEYVKSHPKAFISILIIESMFGNMDVDVKKINSYYTNLDKELKATKAGKSLKNKIDMAMKPVTPPSTEIGSMAPDFTAPNPKGDYVALNKFTGKVTVIDFWASWCGPCRQENPNMVKMYAELHSKGLEILGVSLDEEASKWKEAITKDQLTWDQISNLKKWKDPIANLYSIQSIPATVLIDKTGKIVAKDLRGAELKAKIVELLAK